MSDAIEVGDVLGTGLRRATDTRVLGPMALAAAASVAVSWLLRVLGFAASAEPGHSLMNIGIAEVTRALEWIPTVIGQATAVRHVLGMEKTAAASPTLEVFVRLYLAELLAHIATTLGVTACLLPGLYVGTMLVVMAPVIVAEPFGPVDAAARSAQLVRGRFTSVLAVVLLVLVIVFAISAACELPVTLPMLSRGAIHMRDALTIARSMSSTRDPLAMGAQFVARALYGSVWIAVASVLYVRLRRREGGSEIESVARVFE